MSTSLNLADITAIDWNIDSFDKSDGGTLSVYGSGTFNLSLGSRSAAAGYLDGGTPHLAALFDGSSVMKELVLVVVHTTFCIVSGTSTNRLTFELEIAAANAATNADDVLSIGANATLR